MNHFPTLAAILVLAAPAMQNQPTENLSDLAWIAGSWTGSLGKARTEEQWMPPGGNIMLGTSRVVTADDRMITFEFMRIERRKEGIFYVAQPRGLPPTDFKLTRSGDGLAVFENPKHDHPKIITYERTGPASLTASIEGDEGGKHKKASFPMRRAQ